MVSKSPSYPKLVIIEGNDKGKVFSLKNGTLVIGRSKGDIILQDPRISRSHVAINFDKDKQRLTFTDLKSLNGTLLNGETCETGELKDGDKLKVGNTVLDFHYDRMPTEVGESSVSAVENNTWNEIHEPGPDSVSVNVKEEKQESAKVSKGKTRRKIKKEKVKKERLESSGDSPFSRKRVVTVGLTLCIGLLLYQWTGSSTKTSKSSQRNVSSVRKLTLEGKIKEALVLLNDIQKDYPEDAEVLELLGDLNARQGRLEIAIGEYRKSMGVDSTRRQLFPKLARLYLMTGLNKEAFQMQQEIERTLIEGPHTNEFFVEVAQLYLDFREFEVSPQKLVIIGQAVQNKYAPQNPVGPKLEAVGLLLLNQSENAIKILEKARTLDPQDQTVLKYLVYAKEKAGDHPGALNLVELWQTSFPKALDPLSIMAHWKYESKEYEESLKFIEKIKSLTQGLRDPILADALFLSGKIKQLQNDNESAGNLYKESCNLGFKPACEILNPSAKE